MTSDPRVHPLISPVANQPLPADRPQHDLRLRLKPTAQPIGYVDGGWWPRSRDLTVELPDLVRALGERLERVTQVVFGLTTWRTAPPRITVDGRTVRLAGFRSQDQYVVRVAGPDRQSVSVLVVPPEATVVAASSAMIAAARRGNADRPFEILVASGALPDGTFPRLRLVTDDDVRRAAEDARVAEQA